MTKKLLALLMALVMCLSLWPVTALAESQFIPNSSTVTWELTNDNKTLTIGGTGAMPNNDPQPWEVSKETITNVIIESGVTSISALAFGNLNSLTSVSIPASVMTIGDFAFQYSRCLANVTFAEGSQLTSIGESAFYDTGLTSITIPASVKNIGAYAFEKCASLASVTVEATTPPTLGVGVFEGCSNASLKIYVPANKVETYKSSSWGSYADKIEAISVPVTETIYWGIKDGTLYLGASDTDIPEGAEAGNPFDGTKEFDNGIGGTPVPWYDSRANITAVDVVSEIAPKSTRSWFDACGELIEANLTKLNTSNVTAMQKMFQNCKKLTTITGLSSWDVSQVTDMNNMFAECNALDSLNISEWDTSKVTKMNGMFSKCTSLTSLDLSGWNVAGVTDMGSMFFNCKSLTTVGNISGWRTNNVTTMSQMFNGCSALTNVGNLSNWNTAKVTKMSSMFGNCKKLATLEGVSSWKTDKVTEMHTMFANCASLTSLDLSGWDLSSVTGINAQSVFSGCSDLETLILSDKFITADVTNVSSMFQNCSKLTTLTGIGKWDTSGVTNVNNMFNGCAKLTELDLSGWDLSGVTSVNDVLKGCSALTTIQTPKNVKEEVNIALPTLTNDAVWSDGTATFTNLSQQAASKILRLCHKITVDSQITNGSVSVVQNYAASGTNVTVTAVLISGYQLKTLKYNDGATDYDITKDATTGKYQFTMPNKAVTVTATFEEGPTCTVTFAANGHGTDLGSQIVASGSNVTKPTDPIATGYTFGGWYKEAACTNPWKFDTDTVATDTTLYAKWTKNSSGRSGGTVTTVVTMPLIRMGNRGDSVKELQTKLNALGYNCGSVDGVFGSKTQAAVVAFQKAMGISVDGIVGPETWAKLGYVCTTAVTTAPAAATSAVMTTISGNMPLITKGSTGSAVKALQARLNELGYDCGKVDGIFGEKTLAAVKAYQADHALLVDGKVGKQTWGALQ